MPLNQLQKRFTFLEILAYCHGGRPRFSTVPPSTLKLPTMAANITFEQVKNLLKQELAPVNAKLEELANQLKEIDSTVKFLSDDYDELFIEQDKEHQ